MEFVSWFFTFMFWMFYVFAIFTVCMLTFKKGHTLLGILGIFLPFLWLIGAILPAKPGSRYEAEVARSQQAAVAQTTS
jgi:hypothetical protein